MEEAKDVINQRVIERGYSEELENSLKVLDAALMVENFNRQKEDLEISETSREFTRVNIHTEKFFGKNEAYNSWLTSERNSIGAQAEADKKVLLRSLKFTSDYASIYKPELLDVLLLETAAAEASQSIPGLESLIPKTVTRAIKAYGLPELVKRIFAARSGSPASLLDQYKQARLEARKGNVANALASIKELQDIAPITRNLRLNVIKALFISKGWNDSSLINQDFMDISFLLETVYKANQ